VQFVPLMRLLAVLRSPGDEKADPRTGPTDDR